MYAVYGMRSNFERAFLLFDVIQDQDFRVSSEKTMLSEWLN